MYYYVNGPLFRYIWYNCNTSTHFLSWKQQPPRDDLITLLKDSKSDFMYDLFEGVKLSTERSGRGKSKSATVASQFKDSLTSLMQVGMITSLWLESGVTMVTVWFLQNLWFVSLFVLLYVCGVLLTFGIRLEFRNSSWLVWVCYWVKNMWSLNNQSKAGMFQSDYLVPLVIKVAIMIE